MSVLLGAEPDLLSYPLRAALPSDDSEVLRTHELCPLKVVTAPDVFDAARTSWRANLLSSEAERSN